MFSDVSTTTVQNIILCSENAYTSQICRVPHPLAVFFFILYKKIF